MRDALHEDTGRGDWTAELVPQQQSARAQVVAKENAVIWWAPFTPLGSDFSGIQQHEDEWTCCSHMGAKTRPQREAIDGPDSRTTRLRHYWNRDQLCG